MWIWLALSDYSLPANGPLSYFVTGWICQRQRSLTRLVAPQEQSNRRWPARLIPYDERYSPMSELETELRRQFTAHATNIAVPDQPPHALVRQIQRRRRARMAGMSTVTAVIVVGAVTFGLSRSSGGGQSNSSATGTAGTAAVAPTTTPSGSAPSSVLPTSVPLAPSVALEGNAQASCVESYSAETLRQRAFAFDGTIVSITQTLNNDPYVAVSFRVDEWFAGAGPDTITLDMLPPHRSSLGGPEYDIGSRLLISGEPRFGGAPLESPVAWMCGFSRTYDGATADVWRDTFAHA